MGCECWRQIRKHNFGGSPESISYNNRGDLCSLVIFYLNMLKKHVKPSQFIFYKFRSLCHWAGHFTHLACGGQRVHLSFTA